MKSIAEMRDEIVNYDCSLIECRECPHYEFCNGNDEYTAPDSVIIEWHKALFPEQYATEAVNHPKHYGREGAMECIDEMVLVFGVEAVKNFCVLNAWKYRYRAAEKNGVEDLKKSDWYLAKYAELNGGD